MSTFSLVLDGLVAAGTIGSVVVALFGNVFRAKFKPPKLLVTLPTPSGEKTTLTDVATGRTLGRTRYYHLQVENLNRRWTPANNVGLYLIRIEEPGPDGRFITKWAGAIPIRCRHQELYPLLRQIGSPIDYDFCSVAQSKMLQLHPILTPNNLEAIRQSPCEFVASLQARSTETDSEPVRVRVAWDGKWEEGQLEMRNHLTVEVLSSGEDGA